MIDELARRTWAYVCQPFDYEIVCDLCGGHNITWSEWEHMIWCYDCQRDTPGTGGIFDGPIAFEACEMLGIPLWHVDLATGRVSKPVVKGGHVDYVLIDKESFQ
jgi:hypothetical protein